MAIITHSAGGRASLTSINRPHGSKNMTFRHSPTTDNRLATLRQSQVQARRTLRSARGTHWHNYVSTLDTHTKSSLYGLPYEAYRETSRQKGPTHLKSNNQNIIQPQNIVDTHGQFFYHSSSDKFRQHKNKQEPLLPTQHWKVQLHLLLTRTTIGPCRIQGFGYGSRSNI